MIDPTKRTPNQERKETEEELPLYKQPLQRRGFLGAGDIIHGTIYRVNSFDYVIYGKGKVCEIDRGFTEVTDSRIVDKVLQADRHDREIMIARTDHVMGLTSQDPILREVLFANMDFNDGHISLPEEHEGINFYQLGRNSTHSFYAGTKDGKKYKYTFGEDGYDEENKIPIYKGKVTEVSDWGYMGHY